MIALAVCSTAVSLALFRSQETSTGAIVLAWSIVFLAAAFYCKQGKHVQPILTSLGCFLLATFPVAQYFHSGPDWGSYAFAPTLIVICVFLMNRWQAFAGSLFVFACIAVSIFEAHQSAAGESFVIPANYLSYSYVPVLLASLSLIYFIFSNYRDSHEKALTELTKAQEKSKQDHQKIESSLDRQHLLTKMQMRQQQLGKLSGWWFDAKQNLLSINIKPSSDDYEVYEIQFNEELEISAEEKAKISSLSDSTLWFEAVLPNLKNAINSEQGWDIELSPDEDSPYAHKRWYRSIGEIDYDDKTVNYLFGVVQDITATKSMTRRLEYQANYDDLTNLYNRRYIEDKLDNIVAQSDTLENTYYLFIDLDRFQTVNDTSGHSAGDELLRNIGKIILGATPANAIAARVGGDEFAVALQGQEEESAMTIANSIREQIESFQFSWGTDNHRIAATIGVVKIDERIGSKDHLQSIADSACLDAKAEGRNRVKLRFGDNEATVERRENSRWLQRIQDALQNNQFSLFVQEIERVDADSVNRKTYEVLLRMRSPDQQHLISPSAFLPVAERYNLSTDIDRWVVSHVIEIAEKQQRDPNSAEDVFWVNLSGQSMGDPEFADFLVASVENAQLAPSSVNFEITETAVIGDMDTAIKLMQRLRAIGCQFALDDFGAGLTSFGYLKKLPVDVIKIDGMFIREIDVTKIDRAFTKSIVDVAHSIGIQTVAEFVENDNIKQTVTDLGVDFLQGFGIHRPEEIENTFSIDMLAAG